MTLTIHHIAYLTIITAFAVESRETGTTEVIYLICTGSVITTRIWATVIYVCEENETDMSLMTQRLKNIILFWLQ